MEFNQQIKNLIENGFFRNLSIERGIEKESLRVDQGGHISQKTHPQSLGSSFTNPSITTDFAEALVEIVTPVYTNVDDLYDCLLALHVFISKGLDEEEMLWPYSIPPRISNESEINIATYSKSNMGQLKHIYRKGLAVRYGKTMQCVSGIHYNFSLSDNSIKQLISSFEQKDIDSAYLGLIRNFKRIFWFVLTEFGESAVVDKSFVNGRDNDLDELNSTDVFKKGATSLRMSEVGYQSKAQKSLNIKYNDLDSFLSEVREAIVKPYPEFEALGIKDSMGNFQQISNGILQIENELYDCIRPKRAADSNRRPYEVLKEEGIKYVEVRGIDLSPNEVTGISKNQIRILDLILLHCLTMPSPIMTDKEKSQIEKNDQLTIKFGRDSATNIIYKGNEVNIQDARSDVIKELTSIATAMDDNAYMDALNQLRENKNTFNSSESFHNLGIELAKENLEKIKSFAEIDLTKFFDEAAESLTKFDKIQGESVSDMNEFMDSYNKKI